MIFLCSPNDSLRDHWRQGLPEDAWPAEQFTSLASLAARLERSQGDTVLLDLEVLDQASASSIIRQFPDHSFIILSSLPGPQQGIALAQAGARGYGNCWMHPAVLQQCVSVVQSGELWLGSEVILHLIRGVAAAPAEKPLNGTLAELTGREKEIAQRVAQGESNKVIAIALDITERTVKAHLSAIFRKTASRDRLQLALLVKGQ